MGKAVWFCPPCQEWGLIHYTGKAKDSILKAVAVSVHKRKKECNLFLFDGLRHIKDVVIICKDYIDNLLDIFGSSKRARKTVTIRIVNGRIYNAVCHTASK